MKQLVIVAIAVLFAACNQHIAPSTTPITNSEIKNEEKQTILVGHCSINTIQNGSYKEWYDKSFNAYTVDSSVITQLQPFLTDIKVEIFLGSWCGDSKKEVPRMLKILQAASFDTSNIQLIFVDNSTGTYKQSPQHEEKNKFIHHVPTFIVYENNKELNRIVETPAVSLEKDLLTILSNQPYVSKYKAVLQWQTLKGKNKTLSDTALHTLAIAYKPLCLHLGEFNALGYVLLAQKKYTQAINVFNLNCLIYPDKAGVYDSLGEAYYLTGNKELAKQNYEKVLTLNPKSEHAKAMLEKLQ
jgi:tetratricopeptide (TPR) repeat protein